MNLNSQAFFRHKIFFSAILFFISLVNLKADAQATATALKQKLDAAIDSFYTTLKVPGITAAIWMPQFTYKKVVGKADLKTGDERKFDDKIRIGSITKTFVATVILQLADEGQLDLDDKLAQYYPSFPNASNITIRQMLDMTSGIHDYLDDPLIEQSFFYFRTNKFTPQEIYEATVGLKPYFDPGTGWTYSNGNYNLLGMMIEKITRNKLENEIDSRIIQPLHLMNTSFPLTPDMKGRYSHGYMRDTLTGGLTDVTIIDPSITWAAGAMISNVDDLKTYGLALAKGNLISKKMQEERVKFVNTGVKGFLKYGLGIFSLGGFIGHNGGITGYNTTMAYHPDYDALIIVSVNEFDVNGGVSDQIFVKLAELVLPGKKLFE